MRASSRWRQVWAALLPLVVLGVGCADQTAGPSVLTADRVLHLEDHLDVATIEGSEIPADLPGAIEWRFDEPQPGWRPFEPNPIDWAPVEPVRTDDALRLPITEAMRGPRRFRAGFVSVDLPNLQLNDWASIEIRARASEGMRNIAVFFNEDEEFTVPFWALGTEDAPLVSDGTVQTYRLPLDPRRSWVGPWTVVGIRFDAFNTPASSPAPTLDLLSVRIISADESFAGEGTGVQTVRRGLAPDSPTEAVDRRTLYMHAPGRIAYEVRVPERGRLDVALGTVRADAPVTFAVTAQSAGREVGTIFEETYARSDEWGQRSIDLAHLAGQTVSLALEAASERTGAVALWAAPTLSGARNSDAANVIFYIIDGAGADYMSVYGYNRRTTPNLERLATEGAVFERAYSNSSWTGPSTASFLTSLQHSVLGGQRNGRNPVPDQVLTMAEHMRRAGYQTAQFTHNPNAGRISNLDRGNDWFRDAWATSPSASSVELHSNFWRWREAYPGEPYWVHFQTVDVHGPHNPVAPFAGLFISPERRRQVEAWDRRIGEASGTGTGLWGGSFEETGIDRVAYVSGMRDLYDEDMAHQDAQLGRLVARLKASGEWERTLLIVAADHGAHAGSQDWQLLMRDDVPSNYNYDHPPILRSGVSRIPLIVVWPERIAPGQRFRDPVSMLDMLPTVLDLVDLPMPDVMQGQSLAPLLLGEGNWKPRPVILDQFELDAATGELSGRLEVIDGQWGASLEINPSSRSEAPGDRRRPAPLLLYDLWKDPQCLHSLHEDRPDLVAKYTTFLEAQWEAHQALARQFTPGEESSLTPEQLRTLRSLGYIR